MYMDTPQNIGQRLLPVLIEELAQNEPDHVLYKIPVSDQLENGLQDISSSRFANAVNRTAHWLHDLVGRSDSFRTLAYVGPHDVRYILLTLACVKTGHKILLLSPRNSIDGQLGLLEATECTTIMLPRAHSASLAKVVEIGSLDVLEVPEQDELLLDAPTHEYPYVKTFEEAKNDPLYVAHTSGSTGVPKALVCTHGHQSTWDYTTAQTPPVNEDGTPVRHRYKQNSLILNTAPLFHQLGFVFGMTFAIWNHSTSVLGPPSLPPSLQTVEYFLDHLDITGMILPPPLVDELARNPRQLEKLKQISFVATGGGPVSEQGGIKVASNTNLRNIIGASETSSLQSWETRDPKDWKYFRWHPSMGVDMREVAPGLYEQWIVRKSEHSRSQAVFHLYPHLQEFNLRDLYRRHPDPNKPDYWCYSGRSDDIIVLGNGEKIQPIEMEAKINSNPAVTGTLVIGSGHFQGAALIELKNNIPPLGAAHEKLMESLRQSAKQANLLAPSHAQIHSNYIMVTDPQKPLVRADKGSIKRFATIERFSEDIRLFYKERENDAADINLDTDFTTLESTRQGVHHLISKVTQIDNLRDGDNLFAMGLDSLMVLRVLRAFQGSVKRVSGSAADLSPSFVYGNPSIKLLSRALFELLQPNENAKEEPETRRSKKTSQAESSKTFKELLEKYTQNLPEIREPSTCDSEQLGACVILTGTTGSLGSYLLDVLVNSTEVSCVMCLNRKPDAESIQMKGNRARGLSIDWPTNKVHFLQADTALPQLGLSNEMYEELLQNATLVIHNAWAVNFNWVLASFEPQIAGVRNLVEFSAKSKHSAHIFFISSISAAMRLTHRQSVPEEIIHDFAAAEATGYGASKLVSEMILAKAAQTSGVSVSICRVGQVAGPVLRESKGLWNKQEWLPSIISASRKLELIPRNLAAMNRIDWIPVDLLSIIIAELVGFNSPLSGVSGPSSSAGGRPNVYNLVNPHFMAWEGLVPTVSEYFNNLYRLVSWSEWAEALRQKEQTLGPRAATEIPAVKLAAFFVSITRYGESITGGIKFDTHEAMTRSSTLRTVQPVSPGWMKLWLQQWTF